MSLKVLFVDFNSFFASVEQELQPHLRGRPLGVVPVLCETTCCIAASYEAKRFGVKTGTPVHEARKMCPGIRIIEARPSLYVEFHHRLIEAVDSCAPVISVLSIDEMACELSSKFSQREAAEKLGLKIKETIYRKVGTQLSCSIGIAPNLFLSKVASDMQKPNGLVTLEKKELPAALHRLELRDFSGIGKQMEKRLHQEHIFTVEQLCAAPKERLRKAWGGIEGERIFASLRGETLPILETSRRTIGHSHVLPPEERNKKDAEAVMHRLLQKAATRLRYMDYFAGGLHVFVKRVDQSHWHNEMRFNGSQDTIEFLQILKKLWLSQPAQSPPPLLVGLHFFGLISRQNHTGSLFEQQSMRPKLYQAIDLLNQRYGKKAVYFGGAHQALESAPMRIAFNRIPLLEAERD